MRNSDNDKGNVAHLVPGVMFSRAVAEESTFTVCSTAFHFTSLLLYFFHGCRLLTTGGNFFKKAGKCWR